MVNSPNFISCTVLIKARQQANPLLIKVRTCPGIYLQCNHPLSILRQGDTHLLSIFLSPQLISFPPFLIPVRKRAANGEKRKRRQDYRTSLIPVSILTWLPSITCALPLCVYPALTNLHFYPPCYLPLLSAVKTFCYLYLTVNDSHSRVFLRFAQGFFLPSSFTEQVASKESKRCFGC